MIIHHEATTIAIFFERPENMLVSTVRTNRRSQCQDSLFGGQPRLDEVALDATAAAFGDLVLGKATRSHVSSWLTPLRRGPSWAFASSRAEAHPVCGQRGR